MQVLKDEIREAIFEAALQKFAEKGYKKTTMAEIAVAAGISVGNLYLYYKNKQELFVSVIPPSFIESLKTLVVRKIRSAAGAPLANAEENPAFLLVGDEMIDFYCENRLRLIVALENADEAGYSGSREDIVAALEILFADYLRSVGREEVAQAPGIQSVVRIIYNNLIAGVLAVLRECDEKQALRDGLQRLMAYHLFGLNGFLK